MIKRILLLAMIALPAFAFSQMSEINWMTVEDAVAAQKKNPKKILIDVYTSWCGPCKMMDKNTFTNPDVINYINANYYAVKFNAESPEKVTFNGRTFENPTYNPDAKGRNGVHQFSRYLGVNAYPTIVYLDEDLNVIAPVSGYRTPQQLEVFLTYFSQNKYKSDNPQKAWDDYSANYKPTFK